MRTRKIHASARSSIREHAYTAYEWKYYTLAHMYTCRVVHDVDACSQTLQVEVLYVHVHMGLIDHCICAPCLLVPAHVNSYTTRGQ